jgi:hypothetical protein
MDHVQTPRGISNTTLIAVGHTDQANTLRTWLEGQSNGCATYERPPKLQILGLMPSLVPPIGHVQHNPVQLEGA